jgi:phosphatidylglycerol:prolipoprotein diacylglycerol transferase
MNTAATEHPAAGQFLAGARYVLGFAITAPLAHALLGAGLDRFVPAPGMGPVWRLAGAGLAALGLCAVFLATIELGRTGHGLPLSSSPPQHLVARGVYRLSRHPIYLGATTLFIGSALAAGSFWTAAASGPLLAAFYLAYACGVETPVLLDRYGSAYRQYREQVPFIVGFPFRRMTVRMVTRLLDRFSERINRPGIWRHGRHILFWGYGMWPAAGVGIGLAVTERILVTGGLGVRFASMSIAVLTIAGLAGTRWAWRLTNALGRTRPMRETGEMVGFVSWGAVAGVLLAAPLLALYSARSPCLFLDAALPGLIVAHVLGRIGCAFYGCCHGRATTGPFRLRYSHPALKVVREGRVDPSSILPVQLMSAAWGLAVAVLVLGSCATRSLPAGVPAALTAALYGFCRFDEEWLRLPPRGTTGLVSPPQLAALALAAAGLCGLLLLPGTGSSVIEAPPVLAGGVAGLHPGLPAASALLTFVVFSYHRETVGRWR